MGRDTAIPAFLDEIDNYLAGFPEPGVALVQAGIEKYLHGDLHAVAGEDNAVVSAWFQRALDVIAPSAPLLATSLARVLPELAWITYDGYDESEIGADFARNHAYASIIGDTSPLYAQDFDFGLFLIAPQVLYRDHCHAAPELYVPLTGPHGWRFEPNAPLSIKPAHEAIWNEPGQSHLTKVGPEPFLSLYCWTSDNDKPAAVVPATDWDELETLRL